MDISLRTREHIKVALADNRASAELISLVEAGANIPEVDPLSLKINNNLSDVDNAGTSRTNLGVGTGDSPEFAGLTIGGNDVATENFVNNHINDTGNPHTVTIAQVTPLTTKGDIMARNGSASVRLAVGSDGQVLTADAASAEGIKWAAAGGAGANTALSNLASTAVNTNILPDGDNTRNLGDSSFSWKKGFFQTQIGRGDDFNINFGTNQNMKFIISSNDQMSLTSARLFLNNSIDLTFHPTTPGNIGATITTNRPDNVYVKTSVGVAGSTVLTGRKTGWAIATGNATRTTFATGSVLLPDLAERVKALIDDFHNTAGHGLIGT